MLTLEITGPEYFDEEKNKIVAPHRYILQLEYSLVALSKWEEKHEKPWLDGQEKTPEETLSFIECMIVTRVYDRRILNYLTEEEGKVIQDYCQAKRSATWFNEGPGPKKRPNPEVITSELVYYWLSAIGIDFWPTETWHLNRVLTLVKIHDTKQASNGKYKMTRAEKEDAAARRAAINEARRQQYNTRG